MEGRKDQMRIEEGGEEMARDMKDRARIQIINT